MKQACLLAQEKLPLTLLKMSNSNTGELCSPISLKCHLKSLWGRWLVLCLLEITAPYLPCELQCCWELRDWHQQSLAQHSCNLHNSGGPDIVVRTLQLDPLQSFFCSSAVKLACLSDSGCCWEVTVVQRQWLNSSGEIVSSKQVARLDLRCFFQPHHLL